MNTPLIHRIKQIALSLGIVLALDLISTTVFAQQNDNNSNNKVPAPPKASADIQIPAPTYPGAAWPYMLATSGTSTLPTMDLYGANYLPYLPWIGTNIGLLVNYADFFYKLEKDNAGGASAYNAPITAMANSTFSNNQQKTVASAAEKTKSDVSNLFSGNSNSETSVSTLVSIPGTDTAPSSANPPPDNKAFNADTLFGASGYTADDKASIDQLIIFLGNMVDPISSLPLSDDANKRKTQLMNAEVQKYILMLRALTTAQSMALSNFNYIAKEREIVPDLGKKAGMTTLPTDGNEQPINDASQLQLQEFIINRRISNPDWYTAVNNARDIAIQRETLFVLAEMQEQLYQLRMLNERMLATMSVMGMQMTQFSKSSLQVQQQTVDDSLSR